MGIASVKFLLTDLAACAKIKGKSTDWTGDGSMKFKQKMIRRSVLLLCMLLTFSFACSCADDKAKEKELLEKEKALCALEDELKKREAELDAQSDKPPSKPKKRPNPLNSEARKLFEEHYQAIFSSSYYWSAKDAGNMSSLLKKLKFQREKKSLPTDDQGVLNALKYLLDSITDGWILENFSVTNINSKFNEIVSQAIAKKNGQTTSNTAFGQHRPDNRRASSGTDAENKRREREHLGNLADAILQQSASENSK